MVWTAQTRILEQRTTSSDIHDQEVLDSLSDRPWKEKEGWNANRRLLLNWPDPIVALLGTSSAKVTEWVSRQSLDYGMYFIRWVTEGIFSEVSNLPLCDSCWSIYSGVGAARTILKQTPPSLDREDHQGFVIRCRTYSNSKSSDRIGIDIPIRPELSYWIAHSMSILNILLCLEEDSNLHAF